MRTSQMVPASARPTRRVQRRNARLFPRGGPMPTSVWSPEIDAAIAAARVPSTKRIRLGAGEVEVPVPFPSPADWRDHPIYQILVDRFDNPAAAPRLSWDSATGEFQGGTFEGIRRRLDYLRGLGIGALWLSPVLKN